MIFKIRIFKFIPSLDFQINFIRYEYVINIRFVMKFETKFTDDTLLKALNECLEEATIPSLDVAKKVGGNAEYIKNKLLDLEERGLVEKKKVGTTWCFRPVKKEE